MSHLIDTNILLRSAQPSHPHCQEADRCVQLLLKRGEELCLVPQVLYEFWSVATRPAPQNGMGMTPSAVQGELDRLLPIFPLLPDSMATFDIWKQLVIDYDVKGKNAHDTRLVAAMKTHGLTHLLTFNSADFLRYSGIVVITPRQVQ